MDHLYADSPTPELYKNGLLLKTEFDNIFIKQIQQFKPKQTFYEHRAKNRKLLAHQIRQATVAKTTPEICTVQR